MGIGKTQVLISGCSMTSSFTWTAKFNTGGFRNTAVMIECLRLGSGVQYVIRGYPVEGINKYRAISSGTILTSGASAYKTFSDPYEVIDVGLRNLVGNQSGVATVFVTGKRR